MPKSPLPQYSLSSWKTGLNNIQDSNSGVFQLPNPDALFPTDNVPQLKEAHNIDLDNDGTPSRRAGLTSLASLSDIKNMFSGLEMLLVQDGTIIKKVNVLTGSTTDLVTGLSGEKVYFVELAGKIFYTDGTYKGIVKSDASVTNWGMAVPPSPTLSAVAGSLPAGRYLVSCVYVDANGTISGAPAISAITLTANQNIQANLTINDTDAVYIRFYASYTDGEELYFVKQVAAAALPATISDVAVSTERLSTESLQPVVSGISGLTSWQGLLLAWKGTRVIHSYGIWHHLFDLTQVWKLPYTIQAVVGVDKGCYVATTNGLYFYSGIPGEDSFERDHIDDVAYAKGSLVIKDATKIEMLNKVNGEVAVFVSEYGLTYGTNRGDVIYPHKNQIKLDPSDYTANIIYREKDQFNQILFNLT